MSDQQRQLLRTYYEAEGAGDYQARLYQEGDWIHRRLKEVVLEQARSRCRPQTVLLDAGCAEGLYLRALHPLICLGIGLDLSFPKLARGCSLASGNDNAGGIGNLFFTVASLEQIPSPPAAFDLALCVETIEHVPDHRLAIAELFRVLKPGGQAIISVPTERNELGGRHKLGLDWREKSGHLHSFSRVEFTTLLEQAGFQVEKQITIDVLGGRLRYAVVSSLPWRAARAAWRAWAMRRRKRKAAAGDEPGRNDDDLPPVTSGFWQRLDAWLTRLPGPRRWSSLAVWLCRKP
ncbi:MAG: class I SAM-dependent methyltransferase [Chloroflexi bacterium]|nr:class I SAM-dependent methyltransferase [Chloroflexota bacterium]MCI0574643.1 class I SAM-dependent methyltransferase [Chloroflexota bacterium]MCI0649075.1 class I SAM-dependent methyltransferase [Chloroflexota bacterium]MCI0730530.1 class I SAM-dependent methyltransferase [Chloroflexota bacterium]